MATSSRPRAPARSNAGFRLDPKLVTRATGVAVVALVLPLMFKLSALTLLLLLPFALFGAILAFILGHIALGYYADRRRLATPVADALRHAARPLAFSTPAAWQAVQTRSQWSSSGLKLGSLLPSYPKVSTSLNHLLDLIIRDFVWMWYKGISSHAAFPSTVQSIIHTSLGSLVKRAERVDLPALVVRRVLPLITAHVEAFRKSEVSLRGTSLERHLTHSEELDILLATRYGALHPAVDNLATAHTKQAEDAHMRKLVDRALPLLVPQADLQSRAVRVVVREIVACAVFGPIIEMLSDPDFWNRILDQTASAAIRQQKLISRVRDILVAESAPSTGPQIERISARTDAVHFDAFLRSIRRVNSLLDARRLKNDISGEVRKTRALLTNNDKGDWINGEKTEHVVAYLDRLYTAKRAVEERIAVLSGNSSDGQQSVLADATVPGGSFPVLRTILVTPTPLSYFMEFMDRRNHSVLVQFWLSVENFKNPLEDADGESGAESGPEETTAAQTATLREDLQGFLQQYLAPGRMPVAISPRHVERIRTFADGKGSVGQTRARRAVIKTQAEVEKAMAADYEEFTVSDLGFRARADLDRTMLSRSQERMVQQMSGPKPSAVPRLAQRAPAQRIDVPAPKIGAASLEFLIASPGADDRARPPLFAEDIESPEAIQARRMEAISAALEDIIAEDEPSTSRTSAKRKRKPSVLFADDIPEPEKHPSDLADSTADLSSEANDAPVELAMPGNLQLQADIERLGVRVDELRNQDALFSAMIRKAELTGDAAELKLLRKSQSMLARELRARDFQKTQYEQQARENRLVPGRTKVSIQSTSIGEGVAGEGQVVRYLIEVQQLDEKSGAVASGWAVARRYNEFFGMHQKLRERYIAVRSLDFPGKRLVSMGTASAAFVEQRRGALEKYLQSLIVIPAICESDELRAFLSTQEMQPSTNGGNATPTTAGPTTASFVRSMYNSVAGSLDEVIFGPSMLDVMLQRLTRQAAARAGIVGAGAGDENLVARSLTPQALVSESDGETGSSPFSTPICDLILAVFELNKENNWLRRQAVVVILQQVLGGTIERRIREVTKTYLDEDHVLQYLGIFESGLWPGGVLKPPGQSRTLEEKAETKEAAHRKLSTLMPDVAANMIGRSNARRGARRIFNVMQNRRLNQHIVYLVIDEVFSALFPDA
ncbi:PXA domain-containing protein [Auriculariales sp. MPI-PUGE-AT-0066]|nr:PXA domain-containing protein [Auriculariales sp. MPI-PUGE-AT-0066]